LAFAALTLGACRTKAPVPGSRDAGPSVASAAPDAAAAPAAEAPGPPLFDGVRWSPRGQWLATWGGCACGEVSRIEGGEPRVCPVRFWPLWHASAPQRPVTIETPCSKEIASVSWSPTEKLVAISDIDTLRVWRFPEGQPAFETAPLYESPIAYFSPDGERILRGNLGGHIEIYRSADGALVRRARVLPAGVELDWNAEWSGDGKLLAVSVADGPFHIWDGRTGADLRDLRVPGLTDLDATHYAWLPDRRHLVFANDDGLLALGDAVTGAVDVLRRPKGEGRAPRQTWITLRDDGRELAVHTGDDRLELWDLAARRARELLGPSDSGWTSAVEFSPDFRHLALIRGGAIEIVPADRPGDVRRVPLGGDVTPYRLLGWGAGGRLYATVARALVGLLPDGTEAMRHEIADPRAGVSLSWEGRFAVIFGRALEIVRLRDGRALALGRDAEDAARAAFFDERP
jgi:WD40 repeat protein